MTAIRWGALRVLFWGCLTLTMLMQVALSS